MYFFFAMFLLKKYYFMVKIMGNVFGLLSIISRIALSEIKLFLTRFEVGKMSIPWAPHFYMLTKTTWTDISIHLPNNYKNPTWKTLKCCDMYYCEWKNHLYGKNWQTNSMWDILYIKVTKKLLTLTNIFINFRCF